MHKKYQNLIVCGIVVIAFSCSLAISGQSANNQMTIETMPRVVKGFPTFVKMIIKGPLVVPYITLMDEQVPITVYIISKSDGKEYVIESQRMIIEETMMTPDGSTFGQITPSPTLTVPNGQKYTMLFDLWSILPNIWAETCLSDVPAGKYSIYMEFNSNSLKQYSSYRLFNSENQQILENLKSNTIDVELIEPTEQEKQFIQNTQGLGRVNHKEGVNWIRIIERRIHVPGNDISSLTQISREQLSLHKLISDVNIVDEQARNKSIEDVNNASLPEFFEPERQLLLLELKGNPAAERQKLLQKYPQMRGKVEKLDTGGRPFLGPKEQALEWTRLRSQSAASKDPNSPSEN